MTKKINSFSEYLQTYQRSVADPEGFWADQADTFFWRKKWDKILEWNFEGPDVKWFLNGKLNITENIFERHMFSRKDQVALIWEPNDPKESHIELTYAELFEKVKQFSNAMLKLGIKKGDRIGFIYQ